MRDSELYERLLGLEQPWSVEAVELRLAAGEVHIRVTRASAAPLTCPRCGKIAPGYDQRPRSWRHLDTLWAIRVTSLDSTVTRLPMTTFLKTLPSTV